MDVTSDGGAMTGMKIEFARAEHIETWAQLRARLWPDSAESEHAADIVKSLCEHDQSIVAFVAVTEAGNVVGFAEASVRHDYVNGCETSPVGFLEGIYVSRAQRRSGVAQLLCLAVEDWARSRGCAELGSDALLDNTESHAFHANVGFEERERVVCFRKRL